VADAIGVHHVKLSDTERWGDLILHDLRPHALTDNVFAFLQLTDATDIDPAGGIKLQGPAAWRGFRAAEPDPHLLADLVNEDDNCAALGDRCREFAERLAHQAGLKADV